jgi:hypothetical protein
LIEHTHTRAKTFKTHAQGRTRKHMNLKNNLPRRCFELAFNLADFPEIQYTPENPRVNTSSPCQKTENKKIKSRKQKAENKRLKMPARTPSPDRRLPIKSPSL